MELLLIEGSIPHGEFLSNGDVIKLKKNLFLVKEYFLK